MKSTNIDTWSRESLRDIVGSLGVEVGLGIVDIKSIHDDELRIACIATIQSIQALRELLNEN